MEFVPFHRVEMNDVIWRPRTGLLVRETLPHAFKNTEVAQKRLRQCAEWLESGGETEKPTPHRFNTSDLYKVMEGAALMIQAEPNENTEAMMDDIIDVIARAQAKDGYLYVPHITGSIFVREMGDRPYSHLIHSHELYNVGHLYEAAVAYARATGKEKLLAVAEKNAEHVQRVIFEGDPNYNDGRPVMQAPGHQEIEIGLIKLYQYTRKRLYLEMAKRFLDIRGVTFRPNGNGVNSPTYAQQHAAVRDQKKATGHAVRATYQYAAMAEVDSLLGLQDYSQALGSIWHDIVDTKMHITGGLGAVHGIEGFGPAYVLPNKHTYLETCAAVGNVFFNMRMFLKYRDAKYLDVAEVALLNNCLSGMGADGRTFFYPNPLEADSGHAPRSGWFGTACCPSNIARLIPQVSGYTYATDDAGIYCTLYGASQTTVTVEGKDIGLVQKTDYPWSGDIALVVSPREPAEFEMRLRIPTWAGSQFVPGKLYSYRHASPPWRLEVNGKRVKAKVENGFAVLNREWAPGDRITLNLPMPLRVNGCIEQVEANRDRVCFSRGPIVLCGEGVDNDGAVQRYFASAKFQPDSAKVESLTAGPLAGLPVITIPAEAVSADRSVESAPLKLIPYFAWSHRGRSSMQVWFATTKELARPDYGSAGNLKFTRVTASHTYRTDTAKAVRMRHTPKSSHDDSIRRWTSWPEKGKPQWVEIEFDGPSLLKGVGVYFYDDGGGVRLPKSWHIEVPVSGEWKKLEIYNTDEYTTLPDAYNTVRPAKPLTSDRIRLVLTPKDDQATVGLLSVNVDRDD